VPLWWRSKFRSILARYLRRGWLSLAACRSIMVAALAQLAGREYEADSHPVRALVAASPCSA
jgi:hypothetical protein